MSDYKKTLQLPKTSFPMKAGLTQKEPQMLKRWDEIGAYAKMVGANEGAQDYVLHDGPPYANGHIHMGTALNKVLKDIIVKSRNMMGQQAQYVPGWDCHGLPIEHKVSQELKAKGKELPPHVVRKICREYAMKWLGIQREEFKRLGVMGVWDEPYMTMDPVYEATTARELGRFMEQGGVYRGKKPIHWCLSCETALAEAEVEYAEHASPSIFVRFPIHDPRLAEIFPEADPGKTFAVIWTTTPWTLPGNQAVAVHPDVDYALVYADHGFHVLATELVASCAQLFGWEDFRIVQTVKGEKLEGLVATHPFIERESPVVLADYVTTETGTGLVHTAPGHGREDYETGRKYGLEVLSPLNDQGRFLDTVEGLAGHTVFEANPLVIDILTEKGMLLASRKLGHSYPHCWRCKQPVIFRATTQWFISMEKNGLRAKALGAIRHDVQWIPGWGEERIHNMIEFRPDWCISRQRTWGVPIVALICEGCGEAWHDPEWVYDIVDRFEKHPTGCDYWFETDIAEIVPEGLACPECSAQKWAKEDDILDVWFDSGTSFAAVVEKRNELRYPADLYLEGSDQHRGWFHSSLLASMGTRGQAPYKAVVTHGYVVDGEGRKMSKSIGNTIAPQEIIDKYGAEILRIWAASVNYQEDIRISDEILDRTVDAYRRIRNTCRFLLGNLNDFSEANAIPVAQMNPLDRYMVDVLRRTRNKVRKAYEEFEFHRAFHAIHTLCVTDLSAFYLDIVKDRLYVEAKDGLPRRSAQTVLYKALMALMVDMAPVLSFTAEEVYQNLPEGMKPAPDETVFALRPQIAYEALDQTERSRMETLIAIRGEVTRAIEPLRKAGDIGHSLQSHVTVYGPPDLIADVEDMGVDLRELFIVSKITLVGKENPEAGYVSEEVAGVSVDVASAEGEKCQRCWNITRDVGKTAAEDVCARCAAVLEQDHA
jgi:isoleucyl-tRNA synthetase